MVWSADDIRELSRVLQNTDAVVVADEVYEHILFDGIRHESLARYPEIADRAVVISSFAKTYTTTGWKVGYCAAPAALTAEIQGVHQWITFAVNTPIQMAYAEAVRRDPECQDVTAFYQGRRDLFLSLTRGSRFRPLELSGHVLPDVRLFRDHARAGCGLRDPVDARSRRRGDPHLAVPL